MQHIYIYDLNIIQAFRITISLAGIHDIPRVKRTAERMMSVREFEMRWNATTGL